VRLAGMKKNPQRITLNASATSFGTFHGCCQGMLAGCCRFTDLTMLWWNETGHWPRLRTVKETQLVMKISFVCSVRCEAGFGAESD
jgi:hypothetical protein